jgi:hypothetical protein
VLDQYVVQPEWHRHAACVGHTSTMYSRAVLVEALVLAICASCSVRDECLHDTLDEERYARRCYGVRAGLTAEQRQARLT